MVNNVITIPTTPERFLSDYLNSLNGIFKLTGRELECLTKMISLNKEYTATTEIRKALVKELGVKSSLDVNNLVKALKEKGAIKENREARHYDYNPVVIPKSLVYKIEFKVQ